MRVQIPRFPAVVICTAVLVGLGNGPEPWWPLTWWAPLPALLYALRSPWGLSAAAAFLGWLLGALSLLPVLETLGGPWVWLAIASVFALLFTAAILLTRHLVRRGAPWLATLALPALWTAQEWARYGLTPHGTAFDLAYTQLQFLPFLQLASLTGPWGMSFLLLWPSACLAVFLHLRKQDPRRAYAVICVAGASLLAVLGWGTARLMSSQPGPTLTVGLIASDIRGTTDLAPPGPPAAALLSDYAQQARQLAARGASLVVIPEKVAVAREEDEASYNALFQPLADAHQATVVVGVVQGIGTGPQQRRYNRAKVFTPGTPVTSYDKQHLLPPFESALTPGVQPLLLRRGAAQLGVAICKDMDFTSTSQDYGRRQAGVMLVPGWDFQVDGRFHGHMAIMRGVEGGFSVARAARGGYLTVSDRHGRVLGDVPSNSADFATLMARVPVTHLRTLFVAWGDWFAWLGVGIFGMVLLRALLPAARRQPQPVSASRENAPPAGLAPPP